MLDSTRDSVHYPCSYLIVTWDQIFFTFICEYIPRVHVLGLLLSVHWAQLHELGAKHNDWLARCASVTLPTPRHVSPVSASPNRFLNSMDDAETVCNWLDCEWESDNTYLEGSTLVWWKRWRMEPNCCANTARGSYINATYKQSILISCYVQWAWNQLQPNCPRWCFDCTTDTCVDFERKCTSQYRTPGHSCREWSSNPCPNTTSFQHLILTDTPNWALLSENSP